MYVGTQNGSVSTLTTLCLPHNPHLFTTVAKLDSQVRALMPYQGQMIKLHEQDINIPQHISTLIKT